jgi:membrane protease YdiL (CAAX protease family)
MNTSDAEQRFEMLPKVVSFAGVAALYWIVQQVSQKGYLTHALSLPPSVSTSVMMLFECKVWEFLIGMVAIAVLSRGHLWSYGINSMEVRFSMRVLVRFYLVALLLTAVMVLLPLLRGEQLPAIYTHLTSATIGLWLLLQWMATPIADAIFFFGVFQTVLNKYWTDVFEIKSFKMSTGGIYAAMSFVVGRIQVPIFGGDTVEYIIAACTGLFCAWVYDRTRSLLTPMLAIAFLYGLPFIIRFGWALLH